MPEKSPSLRCDFLPECHLERSPIESASWGPGERPWPGAVRTAAEGKRSRLQPTARQSSQKATRKLPSTDNHLWVN